MFEDEKARRVSPSIQPGAAPGAFFEAAPRAQKSI